MICQVLINSLIFPQVEGRYRATLRAVRKTEAGEGRCIDEWKPSKRCPRRPRVVASAGCKLDARRHSRSVIMFLITRSYPRCFLVFFIFGTHTCMPLHTSTYYRFPPTFSVFVYVYPSLPRLLTCSASRYFAPGHLDHIINIHSCLMRSS